jgi:uncharacterized protein (TIGR03382 family)
MRLRRLACATTLPVLAALAIGLATSAPRAHADGDPASDILYFDSIYTPVGQKISPGALKQLEGTIKAAALAGFRVRVALILDRTDLGAVPQLFGHPDNYVKLLAGEIYNGWKGALIAVQPSGIGVRNVKPLAPARRVVAEIKIATPASADSLARAARVAILKVAAVDGHPLNGPVTTAGKSSSSSTFVVFGGAVIAITLALLAGWLILRRRRRAARAT